MGGGGKDGDPVDMGMHAVVRAIFRIGSDAGIWAESWKEMGSS